MPRVFIPAPMRDLTGNVESVVVDAANLRQVVERLDARFPGIGGRLISGSRLAAGIAVSIDGNLSTRGLIAAVGEDSEVHFLPAIGGG